MRPIPTITAEQENHRFVDLMTGEPAVEGVTRMVTSQVDPVEPVPVGTTIALIFEVTGYDPDCDGSLMARLKQVSRDGEASGWEPTHLGLYPDYGIVLDDPDEIHLAMESE